MLKVLMLGDSQVGKTTYMGAMYNTMADDNGYCIRATDYNDRQSLERLGALVKKGEYPGRTQVRSTYDFTFRYNYEGTFIDILDFEWIDYRGGAIYERTSDPVANDLKQYLNEVSALIVFWDATLLESTNATIQRQWNRIKQFMMMFAGRADENNPLSLTIMLTKTDLFDGDFTETKYGKEIIKFIDTFSNNKYLHGMLAFSAVNSEAQGNVFFPFLHSMRFGFIAELKRQYEEWINLPLWERIKNKLFGDKLLARLNALSTLWDDLLEKLKKYDGEAGYYLF